MWPRHHFAVRAGANAEHPPAAVAWPESVDEVAALVTWARNEGVTLVPFGAGSGVCAGVFPEAGAVVVDMKRMARIRRVDRDAPAVEVEAGALGVALEAALEREGYTLGHFPSSILCSTAGGWVATRSAGQCSSAYGKIEDMTAAVECVDGRGRALSLRRRTSAPDLVPLVVGSEGTLAIVTAVTFRLHPAPAARGFGSFTFRSTEAGLDAMREMLQKGLRPAVARLYDPFDAMLARTHKAPRAAHPPPPVAPRENARRGNDPRSFDPAAAALRQILAHPRALNDAIHSRAAGWALGGALLVVVFEGTEEAEREGVAGARRVAEAARGRWDGEAPARAWFDRRYAVSFRQSGVFARGAFVDTMEVAAPWSRLRDVESAVRRAAGRRVFVMAHFSHAYPDGCCIYFSFIGVGDRRRARTEGWEAASAATYDAAWRDALDAALDAGATISHHHGVGRSKAPWLRGELGEGVDVLRAVQRAFDPGHILNPGALVDRKSPPAARDPRPTPTDGIDRVSLLAAAAGARRVADVETELRANGLSLGLSAVPDDTIAAWIARGTPGARDAWADPADHVIAGFDATLANGRKVRLAPAPRRSAGPDLTALFLGAGDRFGRIDRAFLRVHPIGVPRPASPPFAWDRDAPPSPDERALIDELAREMGAG